MRADVGTTPASAPRRDANFAFLFVGLLALLIGVPAVEQVTGELTLVSQLGFCLLVLVGVWTLLASGVWFLVGLALVGGVCATVAWMLYAPSVVAVAAWIAVSGAFSVLSTVICLGAVLRRTRVTTNHLLGAMCGYLLLGIVWSFGFAAIELVAPGSFHLPSGGVAERFDDLIYLSFVTLTTTGYGDVVPTGQLARSFASLEGVIGQLYVAVLLATLVARHVAPADPP